MAPNHVPPQSIGRSFFIPLPPSVPAARTRPSHCHSSFSSSELSTGCCTPSFSAPTPPSSPTLPLSNSQQGGFPPSHPITPTNLSISLHTRAATWVTETEDLFSWSVMCRPARKIQIGDSIRLHAPDGYYAGIEGTISTVRTLEQNWVEFVFHRPSPTLAHSDNLPPHTHPNHSPAMARASYLLSIPIEWTDLPWVHIGLHYVLQPHLANTAIPLPPRHMLGPSVPWHDCSHICAANDLLAHNDSTLPALHISPPSDAGAMSDHAEELEVSVAHLFYGTLGIPHHALGRSQNDYLSFCPPQLPPAAIRKHGRN